MKIPGWAYLVVGGVIAGYSRFISSKSSNSALTIFMWIGIFLLIIGVFKIVAGFITGEKNEDKKFDYGGERNKSQIGVDYIICPRCNAKLHPKSRYCNWCGTKL